jgi:hypothetical protein
MRFNFYVYSWKSAFACLQRYHSFTSCKKKVKVAPVLN